MFGRRLLPVLMGMAVLVVAGAMVGLMPAQAAKDRVLVAFGSNIPTLDPHMHTARLAHIVDYHLYDTVLYRDPKSNYRPAPLLATSWQAVNPTTWELKLRQGVKFHNGEPFTAEAVKFSLERILDIAQKSPIRGSFTWIKEIKVLDDYTVQLLTERPFPAAAEFLTLAYIVPPKYLKAVGTEEFNRKPVGTGPYKETPRAVQQGAEADPREVLLDPHQRPVHDRGREQKPQLRGGQRRDDARLSRVMEELNSKRSRPTGPEAACRTPPLSPLRASFDFSEQRHGVTSG